MLKTYTSLIESFEACEIDASTFSHLDHVGVAYEMLDNYDFLMAAMKYSDCINTIATRAGAATKFNTTITLAFLSVIAERMASAQYEDFDAFIDANPDLLEGDLLARWYSQERLSSDLSRTTFLMPDLGGAS